MNNGVGICSETGRAPNSMYLANYRTKASQRIFAVFNMNLYSLVLSKYIEFVTHTNELNVLILHT